MPSSTHRAAADREERRTLAQRLLTRLLHLYFRFARGMTLGVRAAVFNDRGEICLVRHTYIPGWYLPGGGVEVGETMLDALERELSEEAGIVLGERPGLHGIFLNRRISRRDHVALFVVRSFSTAGTKQFDREIAEAGFFALERLPEGTTPGTLRRLAEIAAGDPPAAEW